MARRPPRRRLIDLLAPPEPYDDTSPSYVATDPLPPEWAAAVSHAAAYRFPDPKESIDMPVDAWGTIPEDEEALTDLAETSPPFSEDAPWQRMEGETEIAYRAFMLYRELGFAERTYAEVARRLDRNAVGITHMAAKYDWQRRIKAWDDYREKIYTTTVIEDTKEMAHRHAQIASEAIDALSVAFQAIHNRIDDDREGFLAELGARDAGKLLSIAKASAQVIPNLMNAERLSRGLPTELTSSLVTVDTHVTIHDRDDLAAIVFGLADVLSGSAEEDVVDVRDGSVTARQEALPAPD